MHCQCGATRGDQTHLEVAVDDIARMEVLETKCHFVDQVDTARTLRHAAVGVVEQVAEDVPVLHCATSEAVSSLPVNLL
jgi:hypothetical protein